MTKVDAEFLDLETYAIHAAITRLFGDRGEEVPPLAGQVAFKILKRKLRISETEPIALLKKLARYFEKVGYIRRIEIQKISENELIYRMAGVSILEAAKRLRDEKAALPHYSTHIMFAALKDICHMKAEIVELELAPKTGKYDAQEKWILQEIKS